MIHLYAITHDPSTPEGVRGLDGSRLLAVPCGSLEAIVSEHRGRVPFDRAAALSHARVIAALTERVSALPVRFGVVHDDVTTLRSTVRTAADDLTRALDVADGYVEYVVHGLWPRARRAHRRSATTEPTAGPPGVTADGHRGRANPEVRLAEQRVARQAERVAIAELRALTSDLDSCAAAVSEQIGPAGAQRCYLVEHAGMVRFAAAATACLDRRDELVLCGPCPPYSVATEQL